MRKVNLALIASGGGTDARAIMEAWTVGKIPNVSLKVLISTKEGAGCLDKAQALGVPTKVIDRQSLGRQMFEENLKSFLLNNGIDLVFLVGCIVKMPLIPGVIFKNIHPADTVLTGGKGMYGLAPHMKVLLDIKQRVDSGAANKGDIFYTYPTVHDVEKEFDTGSPLLRVSIKIPRAIVNEYLNGKNDIESSAAILQAYVLPYEWRLLPLAVEVAAQQILDNEK